MKLPMSWLNDYVEIDCSLKEYIDRITLSGSKVEGFEMVAHDIKKVVVGKITKIERHPDADKLVVCQVDIGNGSVQIVTGAKNVFEGALVPVALDGAVLHDDFKIKKSKLRGQVSEGMMCSVEELGYTRNDYPEAPEDGIYIFQNDVELGKDAIEVLEMKDEVVEFEITSNRPDCFSVLGLARESAATFDKKMNYPNVILKEEADGNIDELINVEIKNEGLCSRYIARVVKNVKVGPSPLWLRHRLTMSGIRPINNMVDITNYVMLEYGQPMHAFDIDPVKDGKIIVRNAKPNEKFITLDGVERNLDESMLVISDSEKALAIAGIMGGENSKISENASAVLLEAACFDGTNIRVSSKKLGLRTDSSSKFEKGLDPNLAIEAMNRAAQLIEMLGCGEVVKGVVDSYPVKRSPWTVNYSSDRINKLLGTEISSEEMIKLLSRVEVEADGSKAKIKTFRPDLLCEADIAEEVARLYGYDKIKSTLASGTPTVGKKNRTQIIQDIIKDTMVSCGIFEAMNFSFESPKVFDKLLISENDDLRNCIKISNPLGEDFSIMRKTTLNGMLNSLSTNYNRRNESAKLFELSVVYIPEELPLKKLPNEKQMLTIGMFGSVDFYNLKGVVETLGEALGINGFEFTSTKELSFMHPGRTAEIKINGEYLGFIGEIHPLVSENYAIGEKTFIAVLDADLLIEKANLEKKYKALPKFPDMKRDIAMVVNETLPVMEIEKVIRENGGKLLENVKLFDVYKGSQIGEGLKSVAFNISFRADDRTLKEEEVSQQMDKILKKLESECEAKLR